MTRRQRLFDIVMLANNLGIEAIAEGLETVEQMAQLRRDCNARDFLSL